MLFQYKMYNDIHQNNNNQQKVFLCSSDLLQCSAGASTSLFHAERNVKINAESIGIVTDTAIGSNINAFGACKMQMGKPCIPMITGLWSSDSSNIKINGQNPLNISSCLSCSIGGTISVCKTNQNSVHTK